MNKINAKEILNNYPKITIKGKKGRLHEMEGDLFILHLNGKIERITSGNIIRCRKGRRVWYEFDILKTKLIDDPEL